MQENFRFLISVGLQCDAGFRKARSDFSTYLFGIITPKRLINYLILFHHHPASPARLPSTSSGPEHVEGSSSEAVKEEEF
jgi:hypothetical protein